VHATKQSSLRIGPVASRSLAMKLVRHIASHIGACMSRFASFEGTAYIAGLVLFAQGLTNLDQTAKKKPMTLMLG
jgi:hypothetical protein